MKTIEFMGMPNAGKGSLIKRLMRKLKEEGYFVQRIPDAGDSFGLLWEVSLERLSLYFSYTLRELLELRHSSKAEMIFVHRGVWDSLVFVKALRQSGKISRREAESISRYFQLFTRKEDKVVLVMVPAEVSYNRGRVHPEEDISQYHNPVVNLDFLQILQKAYQEIELPEGTTVIDGKESIEANLELILEEISQLLPRKALDLVESVRENSEDCSFSLEGKEDLKLWVKRCLKGMICLFGGNGKQNGKQIKEAQIKEVEKI